MESGRAPLAYVDDYLSFDSGNDEVSDTAQDSELQTQCDATTPFLTDATPITNKKLPSDTDGDDQSGPLPLSINHDSNSESDGDSIQKTPPDISEPVENKFKEDNSRGKYAKGDNYSALNEQNQPNSCLPSYSEIQETCLADDLPGAEPQSSQADDTGMADDHPSLQGPVADDDVDSNTELFAQEQMFTPGKRRKEFLCGVFLKYSIFIFNFLFWVAAVCGFGFGYWILTSKGQIFTSGVYLFLDPAVMLSIVSCTIFIVAFFGFLGALRENLLLLKIFRVCLVIVLFIQTGIGILVFVFYTMPEARESLLAGPESVLKDAIKGYHDDEARKEWIDLIQKEFQCCGVSQSREGYRDWQINMYFNCSERNPSIQRCAVPVSCCIFERGDYVNVMCGFHTTDQPREKVFNRIYTKGCLRGLADWMRVNESYIGGFLLGFVTPQVLGVIFSTMYMRYIKRSRARWRLLKRTQ